MLMRTSGCRLIDVPVVRIDICGIAFLARLFQPGLGEVSMGNIIRRRRVVSCALIAWGVLAAGCASHSGAIPAPSEPAIPGRQAFPQSVLGPTHVTTFTFWNQSGIATQVPASWIAQWATYVETRSSAFANQFHSAGGKYAVAYTDPNYYYKSSTWTSPGTYPENSFGHHSGARIWRSQGSGTEDYLLPNSSSAQSTFAAVVSSIKSGGGYNYAYADGVSDALTTSLYRFNHAPVEITTNTQYVSGMKTVLGGVSLPVIANGYNNGNPVTQEEYVGATNIAGIFGEACFTYGTGAYTGTNWLNMANALIYTTTHHVVGICGGNGSLSDNRALRNYWLSSWWLTYDPTYSVALEIMGSQGGVYLFAEETLVPYSPLQTATSSIGQLQRSNGVYAREFSGCYLKGVNVGACAAVVNPMSSTLSIPHLSRSYTRRLVLDNNNLYNGGQVYIETGLPTLGPGTGQIIFQ
jgi:hypothetical protein